MTSLIQTDEHKKAALTVLFLATFKRRCLTNRMKNRVKKILPVYFPYREVSPSRLSFPLKRHTKTIRTFSENLPILREQEARVNLLERIFK